ncbi:ABC transporter ATP-binding protein [Spirochaetia bacterium 38H-sp]|uniref:ABC transporter ATP-binding protein n=1 Tax=Rarispira pelagica TaxID=3141764 RepID=A0ABU9UE02_9SPIR
MNNSIVANDIVKEYSSGGTIIRILDSISVSMESGRVYVITGESGSGKSTLLHIIGGLDKPDSGRVEISGQDISNLSEEELTEFRRNHLGFVFQMHYLLRECTSLENVFLPAYMSGISKKDSEDRARYLIEKVGLSDRMTHYPHQLSGGERQRIAIARALVNNPSIILADEPTGNLDERTSRTVEDIFFSLVRDEGVTLVMVTHDMSLANRADCHFHLENGRLKQL